MRISDWSSDVCSSDLLRVAISFGDLARQLPDGLAAPRCGERKPAVRGHFVRDSKAVELTRAEDQRMGQRAMPTQLRRPQRLQLLEGLVPCAQNFGDLTLFGEWGEQDRELLQLR